MQSTPLLQHCLELIKQGKLSDALEVLNSRVLPELQLASGANLDGRSLATHQAALSATELAESARLVRVLLLAAEHQQKCVKDQLRTQRRRLQSHNAYVGSAEQR